VCDFRASDVGNLRVHERRHGDVGEALSPLSNRKEVRLRPFVAAAAAAGTSDDADARNQLRSDAPFVRGDAPGFAIVCPPAPAALLSSFVDDAVGPSPPVSESSSPSHLKLIKVTPPGNGSGSVLAGSSSLQAASVASVAAAYKPPAGSAVAAALAAPLPSTSGLNFVNDARSRSRYTGKPGHGASSPAGSFLSPRAVPDSGSQAGGGAAAGATPKHRAPAVAADVAGDPAKPFRCRYCDYRTAKRWACVVQSPDRAVVAVVLTAVFVVAVGTEAVTSAFIPARSRIRLVPTVVALARRAWVVIRDVYAAAVPILRPPSVGLGQPCSSRASPQDW
jgi:hypothetical protein